jgi:hypothetical protein
VKRHPPPRCHSERWRPRVAMIGRRRDKETSYDRRAFSEKALLFGSAANGAPRSVYVASRRESEAAFSRPILRGCLSYGG